MFIVIDASATPPAQYAARIWQHLWEMRALVPVNIVAPTVVSSPCPLLAEERADAVLSPTGIQVPRNTAWVPMQIDVSRFVNRRGDIMLDALEATLVDCVDRGDAQHDSRDWRSTIIGSDSRANRRLAVLVRGWGDLARCWGADPTDFRTLTELEDLAVFISEILRGQSRRLALEKGHCPAIDRAGAKISACGTEMSARWQRAVADTALRHRNLMAMSVWDVFPRGEVADLRYLDLLPLLRCANCLSFRRDVDIEHWNIKEFKRFYVRVSAVLQCSIDRGQIAKQV